ncbi:MAG: protein phosphatase 2C domain-containing protein [Actinomycetales bacterium]
MIPSSAGSPPSAQGGRHCPVCGERALADDRFCEACGVSLHSLGDSDAASGEPGHGELSHETLDVTQWLGGSCDIGRRRSHNRDAVSVVRLGERSAALAVADGVGAAPGSGATAQAACEAVAGTITRLVAEGPASRQQLTQAVTVAVLAAAAAATDTSRVTGDSAPGVDNSAASSTLAVAVMAPVDATGPGPDASAPDRADGWLVTATIGDSRVYWLPDRVASPATMLGTDDSLAAEMMAAGMPAEQAEQSPGAHVITAWLGADAPNPHPHVRALLLSEPGWVCVCSDGLWNYFSDPAELRTQLHDALEELAALTVPAVQVGAAPRAARLAQALVGAANRAGGRDNISVVLARWSPGSGRTKPPGRRSSRAE